MDNFDNSIPSGEGIYPTAESYREELLSRNRETRKKRINFVIGIAVIVFAFIGLFGCIFQTVSYFAVKQEDKKTDTLGSYQSFMLPVAAVDPEPFDDITGAPMEELVEIAVWSILGADLDPADYDYSSGELAIPASQIEQAFIRYFGNDVAISHCSVTGYGYEFSYDPDTNMYFIPLTTVEPLYTPVVTEGETKGDTIILTLGLVNASSWQQDAETGNMEMPDPDKFVKVTLRKTAGSVVISAIQTSSRPETAIVEVFTTKVPEENAEITSDENASS